MSAPLAIPAQAYINGLYRQSEGKTYSFTPEFIILAQPYYDFDLRAVTYAVDIDTGSDNSLAFCDRIFFSGHEGNLWLDKNWLHLVLHEVEHLGQCQKRGPRTFLAEYILKVGVDIAKTGSVNVHDIHDFEVAAEEKANQITDILWEKIQSGLSPIPSGSIAKQPQFPQPSYYPEILTPPMEASTIGSDQPNWPDCNDPTKRCTPRQRSETRSKRVIILP